MNALVPNFHIMFGMEMVFAYSGFLQYSRKNSQRALRFGSPDFNGTIALDKCANGEICLVFNLLLFPAGFTAFSPPILSFPADSLDGDIVGMLAIGNTGAGAEGEEG